MNVVSSPKTRDEDDKFYESDGTYIVEVELLGERGEAFVKVPGKDGKCNPTDELPWLPATIGTTYVLILGYLLGSGELEVS